MKTLWYRELSRYPAERIRRDFGVHGQEIITRLLNANILRRVKSGSDDPDISELLELAPEEEPMLAFNFCGLVLLDDILIRCYPKYIRKGDGKTSFSLVLKAIQRYESHRRQSLELAGNGKRSVSFLSIVTAILDDYRHNGLYRVANTELELNGEGETDWDVTIVREDPCFVSSETGNRPIYVNRYTTRRRLDDENFFRLIHMAILDECSQLVHKLELDELIPIRGISFRQEKLKMLGNHHFLMSRLRQEYQRQFAERRRRILKLLMMYLSRTGSRTKHAPLTFFGTNAMNLVWEKALADVLKNQLNIPVKNIETLPKELRDHYPERNKNLIDIIQHPVWILGGGKGKAVTDTLLPDTIHITKNAFLIYDAKYYIPRITMNKISGQPGLESVTKQYLYHLAYQDFLKSFHIDTVQNIFLIPKEPDVDGPRIQKLATVHFDLLYQYTETDVHTICIDADYVWKAYVEHRTIKLEESEWM